MLKKFYIPQEEKTHEISEEEMGSAPQKLLMLEDDEDLKHTLTLFLESCSYKVVAVQNGVDGLKQVMAGDFDIILCDLVMPGLPGDMFYYAVERTKPHLCKRFVFMTGHKADPKWDAFIRKIGGIVLWKPFQLYELQERIQLVQTKSQGKKTASALR